MIDARKHIRVPVRIPVILFKANRPEDAIEAEILDISEGGAFIHCSTPIQMGEEVLIEFHFSETKVFEGKVIEHDKTLTSLLPETSKEGSIVKWTRSQGAAGFGLEFKNLKSDKVKFLQNLLKYFDRLKKAGVVFQIPE